MMYVQHPMAVFAFIMNKKVYLDLALSYCTGQTCAAAVIHSSIAGRQLN